MTKTELKAKIDEYLATLDDVRQDDFYCTERKMQSYGLDGFLEWLYPEPKIALPVRAYQQGVIWLVDDANGNCIANASSRAQADLLVKTLNESAI